MLAKYFFVIEFAVKLKLAVNVMWYINRKYLYE